jgi:hypothetical protein
VEDSSIVDGRRNPPNPQLAGAMKVTEPKELQRSGSRVRYDVAEDELLLSPRILLRKLHMERIKRNR